MEDTNITTTEAMTEQESGQGEVQALAPEEEQIASLEEAISQFTSEDQDPVTESDPESEPEQTEEPQQSRKQPLKQRFDAVAKKGYDQGRDDALREAEQKWEKERASYEARLARLAEIELKERAETLADKLGIPVAAAEYIARMEQKIGQPIDVASEDEQPVQNKTAKPAVQRDAAGRFVSQKPAQNPEPSEQDYHARAQELAAEARQIQQETGLDMMELFRTDETFRRQIATGETTFTAAAAIIKAYSGKPAQQAQPAERRAPRAVHDTGASTTPAGTFGIRSMSDEQFERFNKALEKGGRFRAT